MTMIIIMMMMILMMMMMMMMIIEGYVLLQSRMKSGHERTQDIDRAPRQTNEQTIHQGTFLRVKYKRRITPYSTDPFPPYHASVGGREGLYIPA